MNKDKLDLNAPAFGQGAQKVNDLKDEEKEPVETPVGETETAEEVREEEKSEPEEEQKVPYSRFKKFHSRASELEKENETLRARLEEESRRPASRDEEPERGEMDAEWKALYGDSEDSQKAFQLDLKRRERIYEEASERARREALEAVRNERYEEAERTSQNVATIDENLDSLSAYVGRDLSDKEQSAVLDIVDEYTPKDESGDYMGPTIPFEKAWDIYELKSQAEKTPRRNSRNAVASLSGSGSQGEPGAMERDKNFNPLDWDSWKKRI